MRIVVPLVASLFVLAACGQNATQRAATGALGGAVVGGPIGAAVGGAGGAVTSRVLD